MKIDLSKHKEAYFNEAKTHINTMNLALVELEKSPDEAHLFHQIFRSAHTLKSLAATMGYTQTAKLCHAMEDMLDEVRNNKISLSDYTDLLFQSFDVLALNLKNAEANQPEISSEELVAELSESKSDSDAKPIKNPVTPTPSEQAPIGKIKSIEVKVERLDMLLNLAEELLVSQMKLYTVAETIDHADLTNSVETLTRLVSELQYHVIQARLVPIGFIFYRFPRMVRDLAKQQLKQIELIMEGTDIELDRVLIDEIGESIIHLVRNAVDHGLETPSQRTAVGKSPEGTLTLRASRSKESAVIEIIDDGRGLDIKAIKALAVKQKLIKETASTQHVIDVMFSGLSTNKAVTSLSGRGLGLGIVKQKIETIGGTVKAKSEPNKGTTFIIELPLTLAIIKTLFVKVSGETYAIPLEAVDRLLTVDRHDIKGLMDEKAIIFEGEDIPVTYLADLFGMPSCILDKQPLVIIHKGEERIGLLVDALLSTQEVIVKPLSSNTVKDSKYFSGAAMTGTGAMILIVDTAVLTSSRKKNHYA